MKLGLERVERVLVDEVNTVIRQMAKQSVQPECRRDSSVPGTDDNNVFRPVLNNHSRSL